MAKNTVHHGYENPQEFGKHLMESFNHVILERLSGEIIRTFAMNSEAEFKENQQDLAETLVNQTSDMVEEYFGFRIESLPELDQRFINNYFMETVESAYKELNDILVNTPEIKKHNQQEGVRKFTSLEQLAEMPGALMQDFMENVKNNFSVTKEKMHLENSLSPKAAMPKYIQEIPSIKENITKLLIKIFNKLGEFFSKKSAQQKHLELIEKADALAGKRFDGLTAAEACKAAATAALGKIVSFDGTAKGLANARLEEGESIRLAENRGIRFKTQSNARKI